MNCESLPLLMNAALDDGLSSTDRDAMQQHLVECSACREQWAELQGLHRDLSTVLQAPSVTLAVGSIMQQLPRPAVERPTSPVTVRRSTGQSQFAVVAVVCSLMVVVCIFFQWPAAPAVAEISLATGPIEYKPHNAAEWVATNVSSKVPLTARTRIRTRSTSLCEIRTKSDAVVRLNQETELVLHQPEKVELVVGELWCRAPASAGLEVCTASQPKQPLKPQTFTCPSSTEMQWRALPDQQVSCMDVAGTAAEIKMPEATCTLRPGECLTVGAGTSGNARRFDPLQATGWQLPLLLLRSPHDSELQDRLTSMLSLVGETKAAYLYEEQIRELGPPGAVPLLAYIRSPESRSKPELRLRAMRLAAELAARSSLADLEGLLNDGDPVIRQLAARAIVRLQPDRAPLDL